MHITILSVSEVGLVLKKYNGLLYPEGSIVSELRSFNRLRECQLNGTFPMIRNPSFFVCLLLFFSLRPHWLSCNLPGKFIYSDTYRLHDIIKYSLICYFYFRRVNIYANDDRCAKTSNPSPSNFLLTQMMAETFSTIFFIML